MIAHGHRVQPVYIASDLVWQAAELAALRGLLAAMQTAALAPLVVLKLPLEDIYQDHWSLTGAEIPGAESPDEAVYLPGRNALLLIKAALWCHRRGIERVALGVLGTSPFADAKSAFFDHFQAAINLATGADRVSPPLGSCNQARRDATRADDAPGADVFLPGAACRAALWRLQQVHGVPAGVSGRGDSGSDRIPIRPRLRRIATP